MHACMLPHLTKLKNPYSMPYSTGTLAVYGRLCSPPGVHTVEEDLDVWCVDVWSASQPAVRSWRTAHNVLALHTRKRQSAHRQVGSLGPDPLLHVSPVPLLQTDWLEDRTPSAMEKLGGDSIFPPMACFERLIRRGWGITRSWLTRSPVRQGHASAGSRSAPDRSPLPTAGCLTPSRTTPAWQRSVPHPTSHTSARYRQAWQR